MKEISKKICLLGTFAVGKTSLVQRFTYNRFDEKYLSTLGVKVSQKSIILSTADELLKLNLMLWDIDGRSDWNSVRGSYLRGAAGALLVCDLTRAQTLVDLLNFVNALRSVNTNCKLVVIGNKADLNDQLEITTEQLEQAAATLATTCYTTSAKTGDGVDQAFRYLGQAIVES